MGDVISAEDTVIRLGAVSSHSIKNAMVHIHVHVRENLLSCSVLSIFRTSQEFPKPKPRVCQVTPDDVRNGARQAIAFRGRAQRVWERGNSSSSIGSIRSGGKTLIEWRNPKNRGQGEEQFFIYYH